MCIPRRKYMFDLLLHVPLNQSAFIARKLLLTEQYIFITSLLLY